MPETCGHQCSLLRQGLCVGCLDDEKLKQNQKFKIMRNSRHFYVFVTFGPGVTTFDCVAGETFTGAKNFLKVQKAELTDLPHTKNDYDIRLLSSHETMDEAKLELDKIDKKGKLLKKEIEAYAENSLKSHALKVDILNKLNS